VLRSPRRADPSIGGAGAVDGLSDTDRPQARAGRLTLSRSRQRAHLVRFRGRAIGLRVSAEAAVGGPLVLVRDGDEIELDAPTRRLHLHVPEAELARRRAGWRPPPVYARGYGWLYLQHVLQADQGCDFDFLRAEFKGDD